MTAERAFLRIGFIPLADAATLLVAVDRGLAKEEGLEIELVREVSWSNVRDKLNIGMFDAAHLLAPVAVASSLGVGHVKAPNVVPYILATNGNAITLSPALHDAIMARLEGDPLDPLATACALARLVEERRKAGAEPLTFGMTFPFSGHNYQLRYWMAAGGVDPDEDVRLVVLPPPYMVSSLERGHVDGFCVGAPWNSIAVDLGLGRILHFSVELFARVAEKALAMRQSFAEENPGAVAALVRALHRAARLVTESDPAEIAEILAKPDRVGVDATVIARSLEGRLRIAPDRAIRENRNYLLIGARGGERPDSTQAAWLYAQMARWGQAPVSPALLAAAKSAFRADLFDAALPGATPAAPPPGDGIGAFDGPAFDDRDIDAYLSAFPIRRRV